MESQGYDIIQKNILPDSPGVYKFYNKDYKLIYVGKAKSLKKRVYSYFNKSASHNRKTNKLVREIITFDFTVVNSEFDALLLENNLIKENQPKYNILLKDDKTFPYICILKERFPRIISTRKLIKSNGEYFGPYSSVIAMKTVLELIRKLYTIRTCNLNLSEKKIRTEKYKVCLEFHLGNCQGPCEGLQSEESYNEDIESVKHILKGNISEVKNHFKNKMNQAASEMKFELAQKFKDKFDVLYKFQSKSTVVNPKLTDLHVFTLVTDKKYAFVNHFYLTNGSITNTHTLEVKKALDETESEILETVAFDILKNNLTDNLEILSNIPFAIGENLSVVPKIGDKDKLVKLSLRNALQYKKNRMLKQPIHNKSILILDQAQKDLRLTVLPKHIECFDNSNIQGTNPVASMVCFINGKPAKTKYRHYNIKTVVGPDDFSSMFEIVTRRYSRLIKEKQPMPNLIVIDGGKGQLSSACDALKALNIYGQIPIIGIAKRLEEIYFPEDTLPLHISKKSPTLMLLQRIRDEAHRFAITFHRTKRSNASLTSELEAIAGIGNKTLTALLSHFKSIRKLNKASFTDIEKIIGRSKAIKIEEHFKIKKEA